MANDKKELDMEILNKIAGGGTQEAREYALEMAAKYGLDFDKVGYIGILKRMKYDEECELYRRINL